MSKLEEQISSGDNLLVNVLKYSFILRYLSNNQVIALASFLEAQIPINLHILTQTLSSGLKPRTEKYSQRSLKEQEFYESLFGGEVNQ